MNSIDSLKEQVIKKQKEFNIWLKVTTFLFFGLLTILIVISVMKYFTIQRLTKSKADLELEVVDFDNNLNEKSKLKNKQSELQIWLNKLNNRLINKQNLNDYLLGISQSIPNEAYLKNLKYISKGNIELNGLCTEEQDLVIFIQNLRNLPFVEKVELFNFQSDSKQAQESEFKFTIKLWIKKDAKNKKIN